MRQISVVFGLVALLSLAAAVPQTAVPAVLSSNVEKVTKVITLDAKACESQLNDLQLEINKRSLVVTKYENSITTVRTTFQLNQQQLKQELAAIQEVKTLVVSIAAGNATATTASTASATLNALDKSDASAKMAGVLRNIVMTVQTSANETSIDLSEVVSLITQLEQNIQSSISTETVTAEEKTYQEKIEVEKGSITALQAKVASTKAECARRRSEFTDVLAVLKLIEQQFQNVTIPDCRAAIAEKDKVTQQCLNEKTAVETELTSTKTELQKCQNGTPSTPGQCQTDLTKCQADATKMQETMKTVDKCQSDLKTVTTEVTTLRSDLTTITTQKIATEAKLHETQEELAKQQDNAKCQLQTARIQQLETRVHELSIKVELGEKCAANYKALSFEKTEMIKQLEKMTTLNSQLEKCQFDSAKAAKECTDTASHVKEDTTKTINTLNTHITELTSEISRLEEEAKCTSERSVIEKYEKEIVTIKTETKTVVTQVESEYKGCQAELTSIKKTITEQELKTTEYFNKVQELTQKLAALKADHDSCVDTHTKSSKACKSITIELAKCKTSLSTEVTLLEKEHSIKVQLDSQISALNSAVIKLFTEEQTLKSEVTTLTTKITTEESKIVTLTSEVHEHEANENKLTAEEKQLQKDLAAKTLLYTTVEKKIETIEVDLKGESAGNQDLLAELRKLHGEREALLNGKVQAETDLKKAVERLALLRQFKQAAITHLSQARDIISAADKKIDELNARIVASSTRRSSLSETLSSCDARIKVSNQALESLKHDLSTCNARAANLESRVEEEMEAAQCLAHKATISELKKHGYSLRVEVKAVTAIKQTLVQKVSALEAKLSAWQQLNHKLQDDLRHCSEGHVGCRSSVRSLKNQLLSNLRKIKSHVTSITRLEERLASTQVELKHTRTQWTSDRTAYKTFKDNLLEQMSKLIALAKDAKRKFDVARGAARNEIKVQDAQWGVCRKEVLNYERILGSGVVKAEKEKIKSYLATKKYVAVKSSSEAALHKATHANGTTPANTHTRAEAKAREITVQRMQKMIAHAEKKATAASAAKKAPATTATHGPKSVVA